MKSHQWTCVCVWDLDGAIKDVAVQIESGVAFAFVGNMLLVLLMMIAHDPGQVVIGIDVEFDDVFGNEILQAITLALQTRHVLGVSFGSAGTRRDVVDLPDLALGFPKVGPWGVWCVVSDHVESILEVLLHHVNEDERVIWHGWDHKRTIGTVCMSEVHGDVTTPVFSNGSPCPMRHLERTLSEGRHLL